MDKPHTPSGTTVRPVVDTTGPIVVFRAGDALLAFESKYADCFAELSEEVPVPLAPAHIRGVSLVNGRVVPLLDIGRFLEVTGRDDDESDRELVHRRVIVVTDGGMTVGIVGEQIGFVSVGEQEIAAPGAFLAGRLREFAIGQFERAAGLIAVIPVREILEAARVAA